MVIWNGHAVVVPVHDGMVGRNGVTASPTLETGTEGKGGTLGCRKRRRRDKYTLDEWVDVKLDEPLMRKICGTTMGEQGCAGVRTV